MSRKRKPQPTSIAAATEALKWRSTVLIEMLDGIDLPPQLKEPIKRVKDALADLDASSATSTVPAQMELRA